MPMTFTMLTACSSMYVLYSHYPAIYLYLFGGKRILDRDTELACVPIYKLIMVADDQALCIFTLYILHMNRVVVTWNFRSS